MPESAAIRGQSLQVARHCNVYVPEEVLLNVQLVLQITRVDPTAARIPAETWLDYPSLIAALDSSGQRAVFACERSLAITNTAPSQTAGFATSLPPRHPLAERVKCHLVRDGDAPVQITTTTAVQLGQIMTVSWLDVLLSPDPVAPLGDLEGSVAINVRAQYGDSTRGGAEAGQGFKRCHCVLLGTSTGHLQVHDARGSLLLRQQLHKGEVSAIQVCRSHVGRHEAAVRRPVTTARLGPRQ